MQFGSFTPAQTLQNFTDMTMGICPISWAEFCARIQHAQQHMRSQGIAAYYAHAGTNLYYFTGVRWHPSERMVGALIPQQGDLCYIAPAFEEGTLRQLISIGQRVETWHEHESPYTLFANLLARLGLNTAKIAIDEAAPFFVFDGLRQAAPECDYQNGKLVSAACRMQKSSAEIALIQRAMDMTLAVHKSVPTILKAGMSTTDVSEYINAAHKAVGAPGGSSFCIVLFGEASAYPHGVKDAQILKTGDVVLIDTGCKLHGYHSDITRSYVFGTPSARQRQVWNIEKAAQAAAFQAAQIGVPCGAVDSAARAVLEQNGFGPGYALPGLPHRTGHGLGLDIHEWPYLVKSDSTPLAPGMCFSNEPMICIPGEFGIRLEDHFYMTEQGPRWFTSPCHSLDEPFGG